MAYSIQKILNSRKKTVKITISGYEERPAVFYSEKEKCLMEFKPKIVKTGEPFRAVRCDKTK